MSGDQVPFAVKEKVLVVAPGMVMRPPVPVDDTMPDGDCERSADGLRSILGNSAERWMLDCACAWSTAANAIAMLRLSVSAAEISPSSSGLLKPCHHSLAGQTPTLEGMGPVNFAGTSTVLSAKGASVAQPAATRASTRT